MRVEYNINKVQDTSYPLAQYGLLDVHSPVAPGLTVLAQPDVSKPFDIYCDASGIGLDCVLMQDNRVIAYAS
jgi:hypothetical protein